MFIKFYADGGKRVGGWLGWIEDAAGSALGFIPKDGGPVVWMPGVGPAVGVAYHTGPHVKMSPATE